MRVVRVKTPKGPRFGVIDGDEVAVLDTASQDPVVVFADLPAFASQVTSAGWRVPLAEASLLAPVCSPPQFIGVGLNYRDHAIEAGKEIPTAPITFAFWQSAICGPGDPIVLPSWATKVDWEAELAVVIGSGGTDIPLESAMDHIAGFTIVNDVSERGVQTSEGQWGRSKSFDTFKPIGPWIVTPDEVGDGSGLGIELWVNDVMKQSSSTDELIFGVPELISRLSTSATLMPGSVISTGTPPGVGDARRPPEYLRDGDVVRIAIERIGELTNPVSAGSQPSPS